MDNESLHPCQNDQANSSFFGHLELLQQQLQQLAQEFDSKLKYDQHKEKIIDTLHQEVQDYKSGLVEKPLKNMIMDVIRTIDDVHKLLEFHQRQDTNELDAQKLLKLLASIPDDLENLLYRQGVEPLTTSSTQFDPTRQKILKTLTTADPSQDKLIAEVVRQGYEWEGKLIRPELVTAYVYQKPNEDTTTLNSENKHEPIE